MIISPAWEYYSSRVDNNTTMGRSLRSCIQKNRRKCSRPSGQRSIRFNSPTCGRFRLEDNVSMIDPVSKSRATVYSNDSKKSAEGTRRKKRDEEIAFFGTDDLVLVNLLTFIHSIHSSASRNALYVYLSIYVHIRI